ncbi:hypothetical protein ILUMI_10738 [Ignelater luminosus]|uniref:Carboxypeptidase n=1 Tax=Ignelater luminosus TaxID=2038154 RepID=A0A8K0CXJ4_IGNLU|nr:hypothetical protein ILUMI_10738 [Ignelater luminosus]
MKLLFYTCVIFCVLVQDSFCFTNVYGKIKQRKYEGDAGEPLILTPLIKQGKIKEAQTAAEVKFKGLDHIRSYAAYLTVNEKYNSNMFFWFFPSQTDYANDPVVLWLQGGPGATSLIGLFTENGPFIITAEQNIKLRKITWTQNHSVLYIDNPVGTGYSFTNVGGYSRNEVDVGENLYKALLQFFQLFPELQKNDFFISGESYGGKYVPAVSYTIYKNNPSAKQKINLQGLSIGNGLSDPEHQLKYGEYLYQIGLIDTNTRQLVQEYEAEGIKYIQNKQWIKAFKLFDDLLNGDMNNRSSLFKNITGFDNYFNYLIAKDISKDMNYMGKFIQSAEVRSTIHVGNATFHGENQIVEINLISDIMQSVAPWISELLSHCRVLIYNGQLDIIVAYPLTMNYLKGLNFNGADEYKKAVRHQWRVDNYLAGYVKQAGNLTEAMVRNAGHMVPGDQPRWALDLITRFTRNKPFY